MNEPERGLFASTRRLIAGGIELLQVRVALLANDLELGTLRFFDAVMLALAGLAAAAIGLVLLCGAILLAVKPEYRLLALALLALCLLGAGTWALWTARARLRLAGSAFEATRAELARDVAALSPSRPPE